MDTHVRQLGIITIVYGVGSVLIGSILLFAFGGFSELFYVSQEVLWGPAIAVIVVFNLILAIPSIVTAFYLLQFKQWARNVMIVISALHILNIPFGCLLGVYGLWVLMTPETEPLFLEPLPHHRAPAAAQRRATPAKNAAPESEARRKTNSILRSKADLQP